MAHSYNIQIRPNGLNGWVGRIRRDGEPDRVLMLGPHSLPRVMDQAEQFMIIDCQKTGKPDFITPQSGLTGLSLTIWELRYLRDLMADERWQWIDGGQGSVNERLFDKLNDACDAVVGEVE